MKLLRLLWRKKTFTAKLMGLNLLFFVSLYLIYPLMKQVGNNVYAFQEAVKISSFTRIAAFIIVIYFYFLLPLFIYTLWKFFIMKNIADFLKVKFVISINDFFRTNMLLSFLTILVFGVWGYLVSGMKKGVGFSIFFIISQVVLLLYFHVVYNASQRGLLEKVKHPIREGIRSSFSMFKGYWKVFALEGVALGIGLGLFYLIGTAFKIGYVEKYGITTFGNTIYVGIFYSFLSLLLLFMIVFNQIYFFQLYRKIK